MPEHIDRRGEPRTRIDEVYTVELTYSSPPFIYMFKVWNLSSKGTGKNIGVKPTLLTNS